MPQSPLEEQTLPRFHEKQYYAMQLGRVLHERYRIITKLGYGASSTAWLARDQETDQYSTIKVCVRDQAASVATEINTLRRLAAVWSGQPGPCPVRLAHDVFEVDGHSCIASDVQACSLLHAHNHLASSNLRLSREVVAAIVLQLLVCVNWLHQDCGVVHTEIDPQNILLSALHDSFFQRIEHEELERPSVPTVVSCPHGPYPVYASSSAQLSSVSELSGGSVLTDFGSAKLLQATETTEGWCMPDTYRAPEILLGIPWSHAVDIWAIGIMVLELVEGRNIFYPIDQANNQYVLPLAVAQYMSYMGPPPLWMIQQSRNPVIATFFDANGNWSADPPALRQVSRTS